MIKYAVNLNKYKFFELKQKVILALNGVLFFVFVNLVLATLLAPLAAYHRLFQNVCGKLEPVLQRLDFSVRGYMMSKPIDNQCKLYTMIVPI